MKKTMDKVYSYILKRNNKSQHTLNNAKKCMRGKNVILFHILLITLSLVAMIAIKISEFNNIIAPSLDNVIDQNALYENIILFTIYFNYFIALMLSFRLTNGSKK
jgi:phosphate starvation-inducible membrane PsiE